LCGRGPVITRSARRPAQASSGTNTYLLLVDWSSMALLVRLENICCVDCDVRAPLVSCSRTVPLASGVALVFRYASLNRREKKSTFYFLIYRELWQINGFFYFQKYMYTVYNKLRDIVFFL
jgi:hypothetical protein